MKRSLVHVGLLSVASIGFSQTIAASDISAVFSYAQSATPIPELVQQKACRMGVVQNLDCSIQCYLKIV